MKQNDEELKKQQHISKKIDRLTQLDEKIAAQQKKNAQKRQERLEYERQFNFSQKVIRSISQFKQRIIKGIRTTGAYLLGRRNIKQLYSRAYKTKKAQNSLKSYKYHLYDLGFVEKGLAELNTLLKDTKDPYLARACAWELALWHANIPTQDDALRALGFLQKATDKEKDQDQLRRISIMKAECYERLEERTTGQQIIQYALTTQKHPDLYLAAANLETALDKRLDWINQVLAMYDIPPIAFAKKEATYDDLITKDITQQITNGPKVSVILPAYNAESGIQVAIESILGQTWQNIELLVVDDCSSDQTVEVVESYMQQDARIKLFSTPENSGPYIARNIALQAATGEYVTVNDADDWSHALKIETQVKHLIKHPQIIANSSEHSRLTESLKLYRRGTPGTYIFPNMSSIMFRRQEVVSTIGYWDCVRFAADGEFKRRLIKTFGKAAIIDLKTGPLSLPRQSDASLTGSSKFGYSGFFMGVRREYVESLEHYHQQADNLYYPYPQEKRPFPVPEPMWPQRDVRKNESRHVDIVIATDFYLDDIAYNDIKKQLKIHKQIGKSTGLIQLSCYNINGAKKRNNHIRDCINGQDVQMLVYGESITCDVLIVLNPEALQEKQTYIPYVRPHTVVIVADRLPSTNKKTPTYNIRRCAKHAHVYFDKRGVWYPADAHISRALQQSFAHDLRYIQLSNQLWSDNFHNQTYEKRLADWIV